MMFLHLINKKLFKDWRECNKLQRQRPDWKDVKSGHQHGLEILEYVIVTCTLGRLSRLVILIVFFWFYDNQMPNHLDYRLSTSTTDTGYISGSPSVASVSFSSGQPSQQFDQQYPIPQHLNDSRPSPGGFKLPDQGPPQF